jgi:hypothetical protein
LTVILGIYDFSRKIYVICLNTSTFIVNTWYRKGQKLSKGNDYSQTPKNSMESYAKNFKQQVEYRKKELKVDMNALIRDLKRINKNGIEITIVAEKPSVAQAIAKILGPCDNSKKGKARFGFKLEKWMGFKSFHFPGRFRGIPANFKVISTYGHIYK